ncbi:phenolic glucoside malonyltransferase 1-like [Malania oleifera]|uniref:phenolic glucoside malonyltransferase 1-like n=1 Tax=Malania oleifera TaxID=397392 RepID=UPI0025ADF482|nr:phenolic glucoside malonyltransferase 1-like [Malania oleifera]
MAPSPMVTVLEQSRIAPPPAAVTDTTLRLTFFDLPWLHDPLIHHLFLYEIRHPKTHFIHSIIPTLKYSLSLTLKHYYPLAGNLILPPLSGKPELRYVHGDSVSLTFAECGGNFNHLTGNHARRVVEFHPLVPYLPTATASSEAIVGPLMAIRVTLFPNSGICIGFTFRRVTADGSAFTGFIRSWASVSKLGGDAALVAGGSLPFYDRSVVEDPNELESTFWAEVGKRKFDGSKFHLQPTENVLATFVMDPTHVNRLKEHVSAQRLNLSHVSSFTVICAYVWSCVVRARAESGEEMEENEPEHFVFGADGRALLDPPVPATYFGNCLLRCLATAKRGQLVGEDGVAIAAKVIGEAIRGRLRGEEGVLKGAEKWISEFGALKRERVMGVAGSPRFAVYEMDFGWGRPKKSEVVSVDVTGSISLNECRDPEAGLEVGLALPKAKMDAFGTIFANGLKALQDPNPNME